jgi:phosphopantetheinyl transferase
MAPIGEQVYTQALQSIQSEEYERLCKFHFNHDHISSLVGRLMLRAAVVKVCPTCVEMCVLICVYTFQLCGTSWTHVRFGRTDRGKPYLVQPADAPFSINVSHQVGAALPDWHPIWAG